MLKFIKVLFGVKKCTMFAPTLTNTKNYVRI